MDFEKAQARLAEVERHLAAAEQAMYAAERALTSVESSQVRHLLAAGRQELALALEEAKGPWKGRFLRLGRSLARTARRIWARSDHGS